jgi:hypothetical protein
VSGARCAVTLLFLWMARGYKYGAQLPMPPSLLPKSIRLTERRTALLVGQQGTSTQQHK